MAIKKSKLQNVVIPDVISNRIAVKIYGPSLIVNNFSAKSIIQMMCSQGGIPLERLFKNPTEMFEGAKYRNEADADCVPSAAIKGTFVSAVGFNDNLTKKDARTAFVAGEMVPLQYKECRMRVDTVRLSGMGRTVDLRYRPNYLNWSAEFVMEFNPRIVSIDHILYSLKEAGRTVGLCEWRPEKNGSHGTFDVEMLDDDQIERVLKKCSTPAVPFEIPQWLQDALNAAPKTKPKRGKGAEIVVEESEAAE